MKCFICKRKKLILTNCHCNNEKFCLPCLNTHKCSHDYLEENKKKLKKDLIKVCPLKIDKI